MEALARAPEVSAPREGSDPKFRALVLSVPVEGEEGVPLMASHEKKQPTLILCNMGENWMETPDQGVITLYCIYIGVFG